MEMVSAKAILYKNKNTEELMRTVPEERPVSLQLFGSDPDIISEIAQRIEDRPFDILDFNMGCPVPKVVKNGEGSALMRDPKLAAQIVRQTVSKIRKPMTVKIRKGFNDAEVNVVEVAKMLEDAGAAAITVHGRTREQYYSGKADWGLGHHPAGQRSSEHTGDRKRRRDRPRECRSDAEGDRLRRSHGRTCCQGKPLDLQKDIRSTLRKRRAGYDGRRPKT